MKAKSKSLILAAILSIMISASSGAAAAESDDLINPKLTVSQGAFDLENDSSGATNEVMQTFTHDRGVIVSSRSKVPYFVKYQGLGSGEGLATAVVVQGRNVFLTWAPSLGLDHARIDVAGDVALHIELSGETSYQLRAQPGAQLNVAILAVRPAKNAGESSHAELAQLSVAVPISTTSTATALAATAATLPAKTLFRQNAFIPDAYLPIPALLNGPCTPFGCVDSYRFVGDNRDFSPNDGASFRTRMDVLLTWGGTIPSVSFTRLVGTTRRQIQLLDGSWALEATDTASNSSMTLNILSSTSSYARFKLAQDVVNPLCISGVTNGIASTTTVTVYRSGAVSGTLNWLAMPSYEIYLRQDSGGFTTLAQLNNLGTVCLVKSLGGVVCNYTATLRN